MKRLITLCAAAGLFLTCASASWADVIFSDNFDAENGGGFALNYDAFAQWSLVDPTVDLIGNGDYDWYPGHGLYVDMDGSSLDAGKITSMRIPADPGLYTLKFSLAGCYWDPAKYGHEALDMVTVEVNGSTAGSLTAGNVLFSETYSLPWDQGFTAYSVDFSVPDTSSHLTVSFEGFAKDGGDNIGMLVDDVAIAAVPAPGAVLLGSIGVSLVGWLRRRRML
ncbi:MAG: hypothetical protein JSU70_10255 [Phycisphaerales bacterium]|nr:MAG: hypothetical protein JSU70_10255 [Phycisphaerales bacterium]